MSDLSEDPPATPRRVFLEQFFLDQEEDRVRGLYDYLQEFPGDLEGIAEAYFDLKREEERRSSRSADQIGHYHLIRELGRGGQAIVYLADDTRIRDRKVAVKVMNDPSLLAAGALERFRREAEVASKLEHPGICPVYEAGVDEARPFIAMRYVEGATLAGRIASSRDTPRTEEASSIVDQEPVQVPEGSEGETDPTPAPSGPATRAEVMKAVWLIERAARALHAAHEAGIIHRDVKPANIMVSTGGEPVLMDFGLAREIEGPTITNIGDIFGTPAYMSPEQLLAQRVRLDRRTDVWSLGVTLYECLTLHRPFESPTCEGLYQAIQSKEPPDPRSLNAAVPPDLRVILETALDKDRDRRYHTAHDLAEDLRRVREYEPIAAKPASAWIKLKRWAQRNPALAGSLSAGVLSLVIGLALTIWQWSRAEEQRERAESNLARYDQMSDVALVEDLRAQATKLWPRRPHVLPAMAEWLEKARDVYGRLPLHETALEELRDRAAPYTAAQQEAYAEKRRKIHAELFDAVAVKKKEITEAEQTLTRLGEQVPEIENEIEEDEGERPILHEQERKHQRTVRPEELGDMTAATREKLISSGHDPRLTERLAWELSDPTERWRHRVLSKMVRELADFGALIRDIEERESFAETIEERSVEDHRAAWDRCVADMTRNESPYVGLALSCHIGLVPLGIDSDSGLWEFWHVESGECPEWEGAEWASSSSADVRGRVRINEASGVVLVLIPGGSFWMGATPEEGMQNHDPSAAGGESPVNRVTLSTFFMSKYEMTQGQWERFTGTNPSGLRVGGFRRDLSFTARHPVETVSWDDCMETLRRLGLELPTEAQWEYACRAGTETSFSTGDEVTTLFGHANLSDTSRTMIGMRGRTEPVHDGFPTHAPVGSFEPNPWGLHDMHGNVSEWCRDRVGSSESKPADGVWSRDFYAPRRPLRGGSYQCLADEARCARRGSKPHWTKAMPYGCRASMGLED